MRSLEAEVRALRSQLENQRHLTESSPSSALPTQPKQPSSISMTITAEERQQRAFSPIARPSPESASPVEEKDAETERLRGLCDKLQEQLHVVETAKAELEAEVTATIQSHTELSHRVQRLTVRVGVHSTALTTTYRSTYTAPSLSPHSRLSSQQPPSALRAVPMQRTRSDGSWRRQR